MIRKVILLMFLLCLVGVYPPAHAEESVTLDGDTLEIILTGEQAAEALHGVYITLKQEQIEAIKKLTGIEVRVIETPAGHSVRLEGLFLRIPVNYLK